MIFKNLQEDIDNILRLDPAARSRLEVFLCYPGLHALWIYRISNFLWRHDWLILGRFISHLGRWATGIEIHPGVKVGRRLFIDHGLGVVIGETAEIGDDVTLYQGVTLGGTSLNRGKRHPTLEDGVIVGAGAKVLGGFTVGKNARIGANAVVLSEVREGASMGGIPARVIGEEAPPKPVRPVGEELPVRSFVPYGTPCDDSPDPVACKLETLFAEVDAMRRRIAELEQEAEHVRAPALDRRQA